jgi:hypothetical protein
LNNNPAMPTELLPHSKAPSQTAFEEIIQIYLKDVDRTLIRENLRLTPEKRLQKLKDFVAFLKSAKMTRPTDSPGNKQDFESVAELRAIQEEERRGVIGDK